MKIALIAIACFSSAVLADDVPFGSQTPPEIARTLAAENKALDVVAGKDVKLKLREDQTSFLLPSGWETPAVLFKLPEYHAPYALTLWSLCKCFGPWKGIFVPTALFLDADFQPTHEVAESAFRVTQSSQAYRLESEVAIDEAHRDDRYVLLYTAERSIGGFVQGTMEGHGAAVTPLVTVFIDIYNIPVERSTVGTIGVRMNATPPAARTR